MNRLASEASPYLRQHADNPVDWYPWGDDAFAAARAQDRPVMLSVGYSSCHWCHVMAHESFEDDQTAEELNARFVAVKVDREERPDVDAIYMEAVQALTGRGGWPMTVFLTPDGRPFFAGTYYPARDLPGMPGFRRVLDAVDDAWRNRRGELEQQADALTEAVSHRARMPETTVRPETAPPARGGPDRRSADSPARHAGGGAGPAARVPALVELAVSALAERLDPRWGGFGGAPKFPHPALVELCLQHHLLSGDARSLSMATKTLRGMAAGGIYDHLGGGFHRYATDDTWTVPHFEKMLYDQAGLVRAYVHAWQVTREQEWLTVAEETIGYVLRDLAVTGGGLSSAEDADSEGSEGRFYLWTPGEIVDVLGAQHARGVLEWYGVTDAGNFDGRSILRRPVDGPLLRPPEVEAARAALAAARAERVRPGLDDKVLTEWNAMFGAALAEAAGATGRADWTRAAVELAEFLLAQLRRAGDGRWLRSWQDGRAQHLAYAADHAWLIDLFTRLAELTGRALWLERAQAVARTLLELFWEPGSPLYTTGSDAERLVVRPMELADGATPSATSVAAGALLRLGALTGDDDLTNAGERLLSAILEPFSPQPLAIASALSAGMLSGGGVMEVVIGEDRPDLLATARARYEPLQVLAWGERTRSPLWEGKEEPLAYVCRHYTCQAPAATPEDLGLRLDAERSAARAGFTAAARGELSA